MPGGLGGAVVGESAPPAATSAALATVPLIPPAPPAAHGRAGLPPPSALAAPASAVERPHLVPGEVQRGGGDDGDRLCRDLPYSEPDEQLEHARGERERDDADGEAACSLE